VKWLISRRANVRIDNVSRAANVVRKLTQITPILMAKSIRGKKVKFFAVLDKSQKQLSCFTQPKPVAISEPVLDIEQTDKAQSPPVSMSVCQRQPPNQRVTSPGLEMPSVSAVAMMLPGPAANTNFVEPSGDTPAAHSSCSSEEEDLLTDQPIVCTVQIPRVALHYWKKDQVNLDSKSIILKSLDVKRHIETSIFSTDL
jgi:hypothetical protein